MHSNPEYSTPTGMADTLRAFIAVPLTRATVSALQRVTESLDAAGLRRIVPENYHLTLAFLGDTEVGKIAPLTRAIEAQLSFQPFAARIRQLAPFPRRRSRLIAALFDGSDNSIAQFEALHRQIADVLRLVTLRFDNKPFIPHITVARLRSHGRPVKPMRIDIPADVSAVALYSSTPTPSGSVYERLARFPLG